MTMDHDLQDPPREVAKLLARLEERYDVIHGAPVRRRYGFWRDLPSTATKPALQGAVPARMAR